MMTANTRKRLLDSCAIHFFSAPTLQQPQDFRVVASDTLHLISHQLTLSNCLSISSLTDAGC